jgi:hypothetical protein
VPSPCRGDSIISNIFPGGYSASNFASGAGSSSMDHFS